MVSSITEIGVHKHFSRIEAEGLLPLVSMIFDLHEGNVKKVLEHQRWFIKSGAPDVVVKHCDETVVDELTRCAKKLVRLGVKPLGDGFVGFNSGTHYWSWRQGEPLKIEWHHAYDENPKACRRKLTVVKDLSESQGT